MRRLLTFFTFVALGAVAAASGAASPSIIAPPSHRIGAGAEREFVPGEAIVKFRYQPSKTELQLAAVGVEARSFQPSSSLTNVYLAKLGRGSTVQEAVAELSARADVAYAEPNYIYRASATPNDHLFPELWGLENTGQEIEGQPGTVDADIDAPEAWDAATGSPDVVVAVIDSGVAYDHPDLNDNIWTNPGEIAGNGVDDDHNGYVDDVHGWDFADVDAEPLDFNGHGTHVAGTIGAEGNNAAGVAGVNWDVSIMAVRGLDANGRGDTWKLAGAIEYACENGAHVTNNSWGAPFASSLIYDALAECRETLHVFSAGNLGEDLDGAPGSFPCELGGPDTPSGRPLANVVCVGSSTKGDMRSLFSNHGSESVHLFAPGSWIRSSYPTWSRLAPTATFDTAVTGWTAGGSPNTWGWAFNPSADKGSLSDSPDGDYANNTDNWVQRDEPLNLTGRIGCFVDYMLDIDTEEFSDFAYTEASTDGSEWTRVNAYTGSGFSFSYDDWSRWDGVGALYFRVAFTSSSSGVADGVYFYQIGFGCLVPGGERYSYLNGTSMATPHVAGVAALYLARYPQLQARSAANVAAVKAALLGGVDAKPGLADSVTGGRLNARRTLDIVPPMPPQAPVSPPPPSATPVPPPPPVPVAARPARCVVPKLRGRTVQQARRTLVARKCRLGGVARVYSAKVKRGRVIAQSRRSGRILPSGTKVKLHVSRGPRPAAKGERR